MMKLYPVRIVSEVMVAAKDPLDAKILTAQQYNEIMKTQGVDYEVDDPIKTEEQIPIEWRGSIAWGNNEDDMTCDQIVRMSNKDIFIDNLSEDQKKKILSTFTTEQLTEILYK